jgi:hypothetical protein
MTAKKTPIKMYGMYGFETASLKVILPGMDVRYRHATSTKRRASVAAVTNAGTSHLRNCAGLSPKETTHRRCVVVRCSDGGL